jgi:predicted MFS family arabinose efflux permease
MDIGLLLLLKAGVRILLSPVAGVVASKLPRKKLLLYSDLVRFFMMGILLYIHEIMVVYVVIIIMTMAEAVFRPAFYSYLSSIIDATDYQRASAIYASSLDLMAIIGPAIAGATIAALGEAFGVAVDSLSFLMSAMFIGFIANASVPVKIKSHKEKNTSWRANKQVRSVLSLGFMLMLMGGAMNVLMLPLARSCSHDFQKALGFIFSSIGIGFFIGSSILAHARRGLLVGRSGIYITLAMFVAVSAIWSVSGSLVLTCFAAVINGMANSIFAINANTLMIQASSEAERGVIVGVDMALSNLASVISMLIATALIDRIGYSMIIAMTAIFPVLGMIVLANGQKRVGGI